MNIPRILLGIAICLCTATLFAQSPASYATTKPFGCDQASVYPITSFSQFSCRGIVECPPTDTACTWNGPDSVELYFWGTARIELYTSNWFVGPYTSSIMLTNFTQPSGTNPGTFAFNWSGTDNSGVQRSGTVTGTWINGRVCGGRGCVWYRPVLESTTLVIN